MTKVKMLGIGTGAGQFVNVLDRKQVEEIISNLEPEDVFAAAYRAWIPGYKSGEAHLDLQTGKLSGAAYSTGECDQAIDSVYVILYRIDQNDELPRHGLDCTCTIRNTTDTVEDVCNAILDEDGIPYYWEDVMPEWAWEKTPSIQDQLDAWFGEKKDGQNEE